VLPLNPRPSDRALFARIFGDDAFLAEAPPVGVAGLAHRIRASLSEPLPWAFVAVALALLGVLAANELVCGRLTLPAGRTA
jgi:hypothetical protein